MSENSTTSTYEQLELPIRFPTDLDLVGTVRQLGAGAGRVGRTVGGYRSRHKLMGHVLELILDGKKGTALDIICNLTDGEAAELGTALDELYPMVAGRRAVQYSRFIQDKLEDQ